MTGTETCDDGSNNGVGCDATCSAALPGWSCTSASPSVCTTECGDGKIISPEVCDDNGKVAGDGCSATCTVESGFTCNGAEPTTCIPTCGSGSTHSPETCDDGSNDG